MQVHNRTSSSASQRKPAESRPAESKPSTPATTARPSTSTPAPQQSASSFQSSTRRAPVALDGGASTLRNEVLGDGRSNCLEQASRMARPGDSVVLLRDRNDPVGHAIVQRADGSVRDPRHPGVTYPDMGSWQAANPQYHSPVKVPAQSLNQVLSLPPGSQRDAAISRLGLDSVANRPVADGAYPSQVRVDASDSLNYRDVEGNRLGSFPHDTVLDVVSHDTQNGRLEVRVPGAPADAPTVWVSDDYVQSTDGQVYPGIGDRGDSRTQASGTGAPAASGAANGSFQEGSVGAAPEVNLGQVTGERTADNIDERTPSFAQGDPTYKELKIPVSGGEDTIANQGCLMTCKAMAISAYQNGDGQPLVSPGDLAGTSPGDSVTVGDRNFVDNRVGYSQQAIDRALDQGLPVAVEVSGGPQGSHWVLIVGKDDNGNYLANDPGYRVSRDANSNNQQITLSVGADGNMTGSVPFNGGTYTVVPGSTMHVYAPEGVYTP